MIRRLTCAALTIGLFATAAPVWAQSLGDVARKEQARRATAKKAVKSFSNADLNPSEISNPSDPAAAPAVGNPAAADGQSRPAAGSPATDAPAAATQKDVAPAAPAAQKEADWRANADGLRQALLKAQTELQTFQAAANDPSKTPGERAQTARLVAVQQKTIEGLERKWERLEKQAEAAGVPREWLSPRPTLSLRIPQ